jgi:DNA primase large subunit
MWMFDAKISRFRQIVSKGLNDARRVSTTLASIEKDRLDPFLLSLSEQYMGRESYNGSVGDTGGGVLPAQVDGLVGRGSFPMCMRRLNMKLREQHHLRHGGRMQYGLFLKGAGMSMEHALEFWKTEFAKSRGVDKFEKSYAYNIRHNYGQEGKRTSYTPYSCRKIVSQSPASGDYHGCPFKVMKSSELASLLLGIGVSAEVVTDVKRLAEGFHFEIACHRVFDFFHPGSEFNDGVEHPNKYFRESVKYHESKESKKGDAHQAIMDVEKQ